MELGGTLGSWTGGIQEYGSQSGSSETSSGLREWDVAVWSQQVCFQDVGSWVHSLSLLLLLPCPSQHFHEAAYMADDRQDLLNAINEFLDCSIVIPPSEVEGKDLLKSIATFQKLLLRKRKEREQKSMKEGAVQEAKGLSTHIWAKEFVPCALCAPVGPSLTEPGRGVSGAWLLRRGGAGGRQDSGWGSAGSWGQPVAVGMWSHRGPTWLAPLEEGLHGAQGSGTAHGQTCIPLLKPCPPCTSRAV